MALTMAPIIRFISEISFDSRSRGTIRLKAMSPITSPSPLPIFSLLDRTLTAISNSYREYPLQYIQERGRYTSLSLSQPPR